MRTIWIFVLFTLMAAHTTAKTAPKPPNIVVILADDMGFSDLGCYGGEIATPHLDKLAQGGLRFTRFYNCSRCCPSRAAIMTGLYPHQAEVGDMVDPYAEGTRRKINSNSYGDHLNPLTPTIAETLRAAGYHTAMAGKWHLGYRREEWPSARGFDQAFAQIEGAMNYYGYGPQHSLPRGERGYLPMELNGQPYQPPQTGFFTTDAYTDFAVKQIQDHTGQQKPLFLYLAYNAPHWPLHARPETIARCRALYEAGWDRVREARHARLNALGITDPRWPLAPRPPRLPAWENLAPEKQNAWRVQMAVYAAQVEELDAGIGRVMTALETSGMASNTLVMFLSDNGGAAERPVKTIGNAPLGSQDSFEGYDLEGAHVSCTPLRRTKSYTHEGGISSPLIVYWPGGIAPNRAGSLVKDPAHIIDVLPTCLAAAKTKPLPEWRGVPPMPLEGVSWAPCFNGHSVRRSQPLFWEHEGNRGILRGKYKLVAEHGESWQLYDLEADRTENHDLAQEKPRQARRLLELYTDWTRRAGVRPWPN